MAENILREPDNPKFQTFKRENNLIKRRLIEPKGALEYALAVSRRPLLVVALRVRVRPASHCDPSLIRHRPSTARILSQSEFDPDIFRCWRWGTRLT